MSWGTTSNKICLLSSNKCTNTEIFIISNHAVFNKIELFILYIITEHTRQWLCWLKDMVTPMKIINDSFLSLMLEKHTSNYWWHYLFSSLKWKQWPTGTVCKKCATSLITEKIEVKENQNHNDHLTSVRTAIIKKITNKYWKGCGNKGTLIHSWWECKLV